MNFKFLFFLLLLLLVAVFSVQNAGMVHLRFFLWDFPASQALVIFLSAFAGVALGSAASALGRRKPVVPPRADPSPAESDPASPPR